MSERTPIDAVYAERNRCVIAIARLAMQLGYRVGIGQHPLDDEKWDADWRTILFIDLPTGQVSWHFHDDEREQLSGVPLYPEAWDGHSTDEKYWRLANLKELAR